MLEIISKDAQFTKYLTKGKAHEAEYNQLLKEDNPPPSQDINLPDANQPPLTGSPDKQSCFDFSVRSSNSPCQR
jgi:hypothetical protein